CPWAGRSWLIQLKDAERLGIARAIPGELRINRLALALRHVVQVRNLADVLAQRRDLRFEKVRYIDLYGRRERATEVDLMNFVRLQTLVAVQLREGQMIARRRKNCVQRRVTDRPVIGVIQIVG